MEQFTTDTRALAGGHGGSAVSLPTHVRRGELVLAMLDTRIEKATRQLNRVALGGEGEEGKRLTSLRRLLRQRESIRLLLDYCRGLLAREQGLLHRAVRLLERSYLEIDDDAIVRDALRQLARVHDALGSPHDVAACRATLRLLPGTGQDLSRSQEALARVLGHDHDHPQAALGTARIMFELGHAGTGIQLLIALLGSAPLAGEPHVERAQLLLLEHLSARATGKEVRAAGLQLLERAPAFLADQAQLLAALLELRALGPADRQHLVRHAAPLVEVFAGTHYSVRELAGRALLADRVGRLQGLLALATHGSLAAASTAAEEDLEAFSPAPAANSARLLADLWRARRTRVLVDSRGTLEEYRETLLQELVWLAEAVHRGESGHVRPVLDLCAMLQMLLELHHAITTETPQPLDLAELLPREELQHLLLPPVSALHRRLRRRGRSWEDLSQLELLEEAIDAVCEVDEHPHWLREELLVRMCEWHILSGTREQQVAGHLRKARICLDNRLYDTAVEHAQAAIELDPEHAEAHHILGVTRIRAGQRVLGLESLQEAGERLGYAPAFAEMAQDCLREEEPAFAARYYIAAVERGLEERQLDGEHLTLLRDWLHRARAANDQVSEFPLHLDRGLKRKERSTARREHKERNARRITEKVNRASRIQELDEALATATTPSELD